MGHAEGPVSRLLLGLGMVCLLALGRPAWAGDVLCGHARPANPLVAGRLPGRAAEPRSLLDQHPWCEFSALDNRCRSRRSRDRIQHHTKCVLRRLSENIAVFEPAEYEEYI